MDALLPRGHHVIVLDALVRQVHGANAAPRYLSPEAEFILGDVRDENAWRSALRAAHAVIHLAAEVGVGQSMYEITRDVDANTRGTALLWEILAHEKTRIQKVIVASSMSIYGEGAYTCARHGCVSPPLRPDAQLRAHDWEMHCPFCDSNITAVPTPENKALAPASTYAITKRDQEELSLALGRGTTFPRLRCAFSMSMARARLFPIPTRVPSPCLGHA